MGESVRLFVTPKRFKIPKYFLHQECRSLFYVWALQAQRRR